MPSVPTCSGDIVLTNMDLIFYALSSQSNNGVISFSDRVMVNLNTSPVTLHGVIPGTLTATRDERAIGTLTRDDNDSILASPPGWFVEDEWNSGEITTPPTWPATEGRTFTLYLLPAMPPGYFSCISEQLKYDACDSTDFEHCCDLAVQRYVNICEAAGLQTLSTGYAGWSWSMASHCCEYGCLKLPEDAAGSYLN